MGRFIFYSEKPDVKSLIIDHPGMKVTRWYEYGDFYGYQALYRFCCEVIRKPWEPAEAVLITHPYWSYQYAIYPMKTRWIEAEPVIRQNVDHWNAYCIEFDEEMYGG